MSLSGSSRSRTASGPCDATAPMTRDGRGHPAIGDMAGNGHDLGCRDGDLLGEVEVEVGVPLGSGAPGVLRPLSRHLGLDGRLHEEGGI